MESHDCGGLETIAIMGFFTIEWIGWALRLETLRVAICLS